MQPENANLLRIRENQRRSRARRKDHVQELEAKLRQCELQGVEASLEIQLAARRVADENKRLRKLLAQYGAVDASLGTSGGIDPSKNGKRFQSELEGEAVQVLEGLLVARKCCTSRTPSTNTKGLCMLEEGSSDSTIPVIPSPGTGLYDGAILYSSTIPPSIGSMAAISQPFQPRRETPFQLSIEVSQPLDTSESQSGLRQDYQESFTPGSQISNSAEHTDPFAANSCIFAADMITTMAGGDPLTVREELGCLSGMDCEVDNTVVFNVMGRYTDLGVGV